MDERPAISDPESVVHNVAAGAAVALLGGVVLLGWSESQPYGLWLLGGGIVGGAIAGLLTYWTREWPARLPALAPSRGVIVVATAAQIVGGLATVLGVAPVAGLPLWSVGGSAIVVFSKLRDLAQGGEWIGVSRRGILVALVLPAMLIGLSAALADWM